MKCINNYNGLQKKKYYSMKKLQRLAANDLYFFLQRMIKNGGVQRR